MLHLQKKKNHARRCADTKKVEELKDTQMDRGGDFHAKDANKILRKGKNKWEIFPHAVDT